MSIFKKSQKADEEQGKPAITPEQEARLRELIREELKAETNDSWGDTFESSKKTGA